MPVTPATILKAIRTFALALPGTQPKSPWPGHAEPGNGGKSHKSNRASA